ncbi:MAG TPA: thermopsin family protease, partial [Thermoplasmata archaeon]|nr:thermopsin family protease [Thermoplasmata archaeon]
MAASSKRQSVPGSACGGGRGVRWAQWATIGALLSLLLIPGGLASGHVVTPSVPVPPASAEHHLPPTSSPGGLVTPTGGVGAPPAPATETAGPAPGHHSIPIPFPPVARPVTPSPHGFGPLPTVVDPTAYYTAEPAPMGLTDFGVASSGSGYTYSTSRFLATAQIHSWATSTCGGCGYGGGYVSLQLNVVVVLTHLGST